MRRIMAAATIAAMSCLTAVGAYEKPALTRVVCTPSIDTERRLVETDYVVYEQDGRSFLIKTGERVIKYPAEPDDLKSYTACRIKPQKITADILR